MALPVAAGLMAMRGLRSLAFIGNVRPARARAVPVLNATYHGWYKLLRLLPAAHKPLVKSVLWEFWIGDC